MTISRREFIRRATLMGGVSLFAGCTLFKEPDPVPEYIKGAPAVDPTETLAGIKNIYTVCGLCPGNCGIRCRVAEGAVVKIGGNPYSAVSSPHPLSFDTPLEQAALANAGVCAAGGSGIQTLYDPFRVAVPLKRVGARGAGKWKAVTWDEAVAEITLGGNLFGDGRIEGLKQIRDSGATMSFLLDRAEWGSRIFIEKFLAGIPGASFVQSQRLLHAEIARQAAEAVFGPGTGTVDADYSQCRVLVSFGDAPLDSGVPLVSIARRIADARLDCSLKWAVVDPRLSTSASKSDLWVPIVPGTDIHLALGILRALLDSYPDALRMSRDEIEKLVSGRTVDQCAQLCGLAPDYFNRIARMLAQGGPQSAVIPGAGIMAQQDSLAVAKAVLTLNRAVGSVPGTGGLIARSDSFLAQAEKRLRGDAGRIPRMEAMPDSSSCLMLWNADPGYDDPSLAEKLKDLSTFPLIVAMSSDITETASVADYILPDTTYLERWDICASPPAVASEGFGVRVPAVGGIAGDTGAYFPILSDTRLMEDILVRVAVALNIPGFGAHVPGGIKNAWDYHQTALRSVLDAMKQEDLPVENSSEYLSAVIQRAGVFFDRRTVSATSSSHSPVSFFPPRPVSGSAGSSGSGDEFLLIAYTLPFRRSPESGVNGWLLEILPDNRLVINTQDAQALGIKQQESIVVQSPDGRTYVRCKAMVVPGIRQGVVALARGFGYRGSGAVLQEINSISVVPEEPRGAGVNASVFLTTKCPVSVRIRKA
ncbi:MAG: molybdopterin-dependent oxidoreductase [Thermodesulfobacteriota bacterium]